MPYSQDLDNVYIVWQKMLNWHGAFGICKACAPILCRCHGLQTQTGNHGRVGKAPKYTRPGEGLQLKGTRRTGYLFCSTGSAKENWLGCACVRACVFKRHFICSFFLKLEFFPCKVTCVASNDPFIREGPDSALA